MTHTISEAARYAGVSVRVLRHYDEIGLLQPSSRTDAGYRQYSDDDLLTLQRIVAYRAMGMGLAGIRHVLTGTPSDAIAQLEAQEQTLRAALQRTAAQLEDVTMTRRARRMGMQLNADEVREVFGDEDPTRYQEEAEHRWGHTNAYRESHRRTSSYTKEDWARQAAELEAIEQAFADALAAGLPADSAPAKEAAERHRRQIDTWFYPCSYEMQTGLAEMYIADERFTAHYEARAAGLARYVYDAILANALEHL